jgi:hypothetical protein
MEFLSRCRVVSVCLIVLLAAAPALLSQTEQSLAEASPSETGVAPEWDIRKTILEFVDGNAQLKPVLEQIHPQEWTAKGAPEAYVFQHKAILSHIDNVTSSARALHQSPEKLNVALDTLFRVQGMQVVLDSFIEGLDRYQNPAAARLLRSVSTMNSNNVDKLREYILQLAESKEAEFRVVDQEAQRCRSMILKGAQPAPPPPAAKRPVQTPAPKPAVPQEKKPQ